MLKARGKDGLSFLHEVIVKVGLPPVIQILLQCLLRKHVIICVVFLPRLLPPFLCDSDIFLLLYHIFALLILRVFPIPGGTRRGSSYPLQHKLLLSVSYRSIPPIPLHRQIRKPLGLRLVETVDDGVGACLNEDLFDLTLVFEANLAHSHAAVLFKVRPRRVHNIDVVFFVTWTGGWGC